MSISTALRSIIDVDTSLCVNCHKCISVCPVKYCNDGSGDVVKLNSDTCIGCGNCIDACTHNARFYIDDFKFFINDLIAGQKIVIVAAPSVAASFPNQYLKLNSFFKELGVEAVFDVSFGAELTVKSYLEYIKKEEPKTVIAQPCPAIVSYIELYKPELIKYLAPVDSPILHTIKMIKEYYPDYKNHKIAVVSPCIAKRREYDDTGYGDYNLAIKSIDKFLTENKINLSKYSDTDFDNPDAERAVLFSSPGGLTKTIERWIPDIAEKTRKIEGVELIYKYLDKLEENIESGKAPLIIDCLSCENGCNQGPVTLAREQSPDESEFLISQRSKELKEKYLAGNDNDKQKSKQEIEKILNRYWDYDLFKRNYTNKWENNQLKYPTEEEIDIIFKNLLKDTKEDIQNCSACGYGSCEGMAVAIHNGLNRAENCHLYLKKQSEINLVKSEKNKLKLETILHTAVDGFVEVNENEVIISANESMKKILKKSDIIGRSLYEFLDNKNQRIITEQVIARKQGQNSTYEIKFTQSDGKKIPALVSGSPLFDYETHKIIGSFALVTDISHLKKTESELKDAKENLEQKVIERTARLNEILEEVRQQKEEILTQKEAIEESESKIANILQMLPNSVLITDEKGQVVYWNKAIEDLTGYNADLMIGKGDYEYSIPFFGEKRPMLLDLLMSNEDLINEKYSNVEKHGLSIKAETYVPNLKGKERYLICNATLLYDKNDKYIGAIEVIEDITERQKEQEQIKRQKEQLSIQTARMSEMIEELEVSNSIIEEINSELSQLSIAVSETDNAIVIMDKKGNFEWVNKAFNKIYGYNFDSSINNNGNNNILKFSQNSYIEKIFAEVLEYGQSKTFSSYELNKDGEKIYTQTTLSPILDEEDSIIKLVAINSDVSKLKEAEEKLIQQKEEIENQRDAISITSKKITQIIQSLPDPAFVIDAYGYVEHWNQAMEEMTGIKAIDIVGKGDRCYSIPFYNEKRMMLIDYSILNDEKLYKDYPNIRYNNNILQTEIQLPELNGHAKYLLASATAIYDKEREVIGAIEIIHDITEKQEYLKEIEDQRQNIMKSIQYAVRIQEAFMPDISQIANIFSDYFVIFKPRDFVSGDFYWTVRKDNKTILVAADCTGHGVPGALMSILGISFLNQITSVPKNIESNIILDILKTTIIKYLKQDIDDINASRDGMDVSLIIYDEETKTLEFSGANLSVFIISEQQPEGFEQLNYTRIYNSEEDKRTLYEIKGDRMPVGVYVFKNAHFTKNIVKLHSKDKVYMFSDGYPDLYGDDGRSKFTIKRFKDLLIKTSVLTLSEQQEALVENFYEWKGSAKQIDDILVMAFEI